MKLSDHAKGAWAAYTEDPTSPKPVALGYTTVTMLSKNRGFVGLFGGQIHVAIKGTSSADDLVRDADILLTDVTPAVAREGLFAGTWKGVRIHAGFYGEILDIHLEVQQIVDGLLLVEPEARTLPLVLKGHSLGGAVATGLACLVPFWRTQFPSIELYTFGSPRCGNPTWATLAAAAPVTHVRCVHDRDAVPHVPKTLWFPRAEHYVHVGKLLHLAPDGSKLRWFHRLWRRLTDDVPLLSDHFVAKYVTALEAYES